MLLMMQRKERKGTTQEKKVMKQSCPADSLKSWKGSNGHLEEGTRKVREEGMGKRMEDEGVPMYTDVAFSLLSSPRLFSPSLLPSLPPSLLPSLPPSLLPSLPPSLLPSPFSLLSPLHLVPDPGDRPPKRPSVKLRRYAT